MKAFEFPLRRALEWRRSQLALEEDRLRRVSARVEEIALERARLGLARERAEVAVLQTAVVVAADLWALAAFRRRLLAELGVLESKQAVAEAELAAQRLKVVEAERRCRLLENLEKRRYREWRRAEDKEIETQAGESFLASWNRSSH